jgi:predicted secreted protein
MLSLLTRVQMHEEESPSSNCTAAAGDNNHVRRYMLRATVRSNLFVFEIRHGATVMENTSSDDMAPPQLLRLARCPSWTCPDRHNL